MNQYLRNTLGSSLFIAGLLCASLATAQVEPDPAPAEASPEPESSPGEGSSEPVEPEAEPAGPPAATKAAPTPVAETPVAPEPVPAMVPTPAPTPAPIEPAPFPLTVGGSFWTRYEMRAGYAEHNLTHPRLHREGDYLVSRARLVLATTPADVGDGVKVSARFVPQAAYTFGENTGAAPTVSDHPALTLYEGFASVATSRYRFEAGRMMLDYGDALVIGNLGWNEAARAFNGARLRLTPGEKPLYIDVIATLISEGRAVTREPFSGDTYFYGVYAGLGPLIAEEMELDGYVLGQSSLSNEEIALTDPADPTATATGDQDSATFVTVGARLKGKASLVDYRAEAGVQFGKRPVTPVFANPAPDAQDKFGYQLDAEVGVSPVKGVRIGLEGLIASGDDPSTSDEFEGYDELYPTSHKFLGWADVVGPRTNVASGVLHLKLVPTEPLTLSLDGHYFSRLEAGGDGKDGSMGMELDAQVLYAIGGGASLRGMYAVFLPNEDFWETKSQTPEVGGDPIHFFELQFSYDLK